MIHRRTTRRSLTLSLSLSLSLSLRTSTPALARSLVLLERSCVTAVRTAKAGACDCVGSAVSCCDALPNPTKVSPLSFLFVLNLQLQICKASVGFPIDRGAPSPTLDLRSHCFKVVCSASLTAGSRPNTGCSTIPATKRAQHRVADSPERRPEEVARFGDQQSAAAGCLNIA